MEERPKSKTKVYVIKLAYGNISSRKRIKMEGGVEPDFQLTPILGVGVLINGVLKAHIPVTVLDKEDADELFGKYGIPKQAVITIVSEIAEETRGEKELHLD